MEDVVDVAGGHLEGGFVVDVADKEFDLASDVRVVGLVFVAHVVVLLIIPGEDAYLLDVGLEEAFQHGVPEAPGPADDHQGFVFENGHI